MHLNVTGKREQVKIEGPVLGHERDPHREDLGGVRGCEPQAARHREKSWIGSDGIWRRWSREVRP
eukprot:6194611-Pleurochrysis_carterae.AAC.2